MKSAALITATLLGSLSPQAFAATSTETLNARCEAQQRTIKELEKEIDKLHALLASNKGPSLASKAPTMGTYTVRSGDSLSKIARTHGIKLSSLLAANSSINPNRLRIGQKVKIPGKITPKAVIAQAPPKAEVLPPVLEPTIVKEAPSPSTKQYTVKKGDNLYKIARAHDTSVANILELNQGLNPNKIRIGQNINLTSSTNNKTATTPTKAVAETCPVPDKKKAIVKKPAPSQKTEQVAHAPKQAKVRTVSVTRQMTFGDFASTHGSTVEQINEMNGLKLTKSTVLAQGSELYIPNIQH